VKNMNAKNLRNKSFNAMLNRFFVLISVFLAISLGTAFATHTSTAELQPEWSAANQQNFYTVTICNDGSSTHSIDEVRIYQNVNYIDFFADEKTGWYKAEFNPVKKHYQYTAETTDDFIDPGECADFTFSATTPSSGCEWEWKFETRDVTDTWITIYDTTSVDDVEPMIIKTLGEPKIVNGETWITQNTLISLEVYDQGECGISGLKFCEYRYDVDGNEVLAWTTIGWDEIIEDHYYYAFNYEEDSQHFLEIRCFDNAGKMAYHSQTERVDTASPISDNWFVGPQKFEEGIQWIDGVTELWLGAYDPDPTDEGCNIGVDKTWYINTIDETDNACYEPGEFCMPIKGEMVSPYDVPECINDVQEYCTLYWMRDEFESWEDCVEYWAHHGEGCQVDPLWKLWRGEPIYEEESCHVLQYYSVDHLGNTERMNVDCFFVDKTAPEVSKDNGDAISDFGEPAFKNEGNPNGEFHWLTTRMPIEFDCVDQMPHPSGDEELCFKVSYDYPEWGYITEDYCKDGYMNENGYCCVDVSGKEVYDFYFQEESMHNLEYYCVDAVEKKSDVHVQYYKVDDTAPSIEKYMFGSFLGDCPDGSDLQHGDCYVADNCGSGVEVYAYDGGDICAVGGLDCYYEIWWNTDEKTCMEHDRYYYDGWCLINENEFSDYAEIIFTEDSTHYLDIYCEDALGNKMSHGETFLVDSTPPVTEKWYGEPYVYDEFENGWAYWINSSTPVYLQAEDNKVGVDKIYWRNMLVTDPDAAELICRHMEGEGSYCDPDYYGRYVDLETGWNVYDGAFYKPEDSCHIIEYYAEDRLGNVEEPKWQCVYVDNLPPEVTKRVGEPKVLYSEEPLIYYINGQTPIELTCDDSEPHPVGYESFWYRYTVSEDCESWGDWTEWIPVSEGAITFPTDCCHKMEYYCVDGLGNAGPVFEEIDIVDSQPPVITMDIVGPNLEKECPELEMEPCEGWSCLDGLEKDFFTTGRYGDNNPTAGAWELAIWEVEGVETVVAQDNYGFESGADVSFSLSYDPSDGSIVYTLDDKTLMWTYDAGMAFEYIIPFAKGDGNGNNVELKGMLLNGEPIPDLLSGNGYAGIRVPLTDADQVGGFTLTGMAKLMWDESPANEKPGFHIFAMNTHVPSETTTCTYSLASGNRLKRLRFSASDSRKRAVSSPAQNGNFIHRLRVVFPRMPPTVESEAWVKRATDVS
jgi:hypothetical protein